jgi:cadmium resistance protein CadD (predicted permease)
MKTRDVLRAQGGYYIGSGLLPLVSMPLFERITGRKWDRWLVQMVGLLAVSIGISVLVASRNEEVDPSIVTLAVASALSFAGIDVVHVARRRISPVYLADAGTEVILLALLVFAASSEL